MAAVTVSSSPPSRRAYSESHSKHPLHSPLGRVTRHMTNHVIPSNQYQSDPAKPSAVEEVRVSSEVRGEREGRGEGSGESTAEEVDMPPNESTTTTDTLPEANEPVDFIECDHAIPRAYSTSILPHNGHGHIPRVIASSGLQGYENWSVLVEIQTQHQAPGIHTVGKRVVGWGSRGSLQRKGKMIRGGLKERQRAPCPTPRQNKLKNQHTRPVPISRKRRPSGRQSRPSHSVSEGDMAMADEMGEGDGEGADDGFVDCAGGEVVKRRIKKRGGGLHMLIPAMGQGNATSPPSSPSNTPMSRRRTSSRKSRLKPRPRKSTKQHKLASADISTQETTTPGPNSSDTTDNTDSHDELQRGLAIGEICDHNGLTEEHRAHSATPNHASASSESSSHLSASEASGGLEYPSALEDTPDPDIVLHKSVSVSTHTSSVTTTMGNRVPQTAVSFSQLNSANRDSNEASDTDKASMPPQPSSVQPKLRVPWSNKTKKFDSDFSTAPLSSETSDMDTSGHEKVCSDGGSTGDLTAISQDSRSDMSSDLIPSSHSASASGGKRPVSGKKKRDGRTLPQNYAIRKKEAGTTASPPPSKRQLQASLSTPLKTNGNASPKQQVATVVSDSNGRVTSKAPHRPKPPIAAKPAKPEVKPKPPVGGKGGTQSHQNTNCSSDVEAVDFASEHTNATSNARSRSELAIPHIGSPKAPQKCLRKVSSESNVIKVVSSSPTFVPNQLSNVCEESEGKDNRLKKAQSPRPTRFSPRPQLLPTKPKPPVTVSRRVSPTPQPKPKTSPKSPPAQRKLFTIDDQASSETASSLPSSPFMTKRKPVPAQKPTVPLKRPGLFHTSASSAAILVPSSGECSNSTSPLVKKKLSSNGDGENGPPAKPYTKRREVFQMGQTQSSPTLTPSVSPTPLQLPPRSPVLRRRDGDLVGSPGSPSVQPATHTTSSSSQEEAPPPVPHRKGERKSVVLSEAVAKMAGLSPSTESTSQTPPPVLRNLKPPAQREETPSTGKKPKTLRRPPPTPPLSPSPPPLPVLTKTITRSTSSITTARTADPASPKRHSLFINPPLPEIDVPQMNDNRSEKKKEFEKLYQQSIANSTADTPKKSDSESSTPTVHRKPYRHNTHYELTFIDSEKPPVLLKCASEASCIGSPKSSDSVPPPLPSQPIPSKKGRHQLLKRGPIRAQNSTSPPSQKSDEGNRSDAQSGSSETSARIRHTTSKNRIYDEINDMPAEKSKKSRSPGFFSKLTRNDSKESVSTKGTGRPESPFRREAKSFSSIMLRRSNSDRFKNKLSLVPTGNAFVAAKTAVHRTPSVDKLDDRMERSVRMSAPQAEGESSSDDEETALSPTQQGLPQPPLSRYTGSHKAQRRRISAYVIPADEEPLYQYINTAEFLRTPQENVKTGLTKNQLDIARQLSSRRLWCEQPEIMSSGVLESLSEDEKKLQEAIFEVVTTEATYLRSLDVLIDHFMEDPGMNPNLPEGRRVLDKRQHHVIFSNVQEVREVSARFLEELRARQKETDTCIIRGIADIVLEYAEKKFDCYVRYCTNQIYQTRELQECLERNTMFREYLRRLEKHKRCQNLSMLSFLLLPMQRITRLPLLILAILNKTPLDHEDHKLVENSLRTVQKLVTECNDGARKMERTEQLHNIHQQLDFGKLKPFPLVSVSRQLERKGTVMRLKVEQKLFGRHQIKRTQMYLFVFTDMVIITKKKKDPKGEYVYKVVDYSSRAVVEMEDIGIHPGVTFPKHTFGEQDTVANATWAVSTAGEKHAFLLILLDNVNHHSEKYIFVAQNDTDKTRWMESLATPESQREDEKIYQTWDCPQVQAIYDYKAAQPDELSLERGDVVKVYRKMADGWYEGERLRDLQWGWFPSNFTREIENEHTRARNLRETHRLLSLPYNPEEYIAKFTTIR